MNINDPLALKIEVPAEIVKVLVEKYIETKIPQGGGNMSVRFVVCDAPRDMRGEPSGPPTFSKAIVTVGTTF